MTPREDDPRRWKGLRPVFRLPFSPSRLDADIDEELRFHLEGRIEELMRREGYSREAAEAEAYRRFGDYARYRRAARDIDHLTHRRRHRMEFGTSIVRELRLAARSLRRTPVFSLVAIATLALGLGAATAIFSLLDAVVLRPLPYPEADRLVVLSSPVPRLQGQTRWGLARHEMFYFLSQGRTLEDLAVYQTGEASVRGTAPGEQTERVRTAGVSASIFSVLGLRPLLGRVLLPEENSNPQPTVAVLGYEFWTRRFSGDSAVIGQAVNVEGLPLTIVGVLPPGGHLPDLRVDVWYPAHVDSTTTWNNHTWSAIGRLKPGVTPDDAERDLAPLTARLPEAFPSVYNPRFIEQTGFRTEVVSLRDAVVGDIVTRALWALFGAVALVLLIAGANIANLFLVRIDARRRETAVRSALGAGRGQLASQYLAEGLLIGVLSGLGALAVARGMLGMMVTLAPSELPRLAEVAMTGAGIAFALGGALVAALLLGCLPLVNARLDVAALRDSGRGNSASRRRMAVRRLLVATQMALAVVLLAAAGLMIRTYRNLQAVQPGFDPERVLTLSIALPSEEYSPGAGREYYDAAVRTSGLYERLARQIEALPGVTRASFTTHLPLVSGDWCSGVTLEGPTPEAVRGTCPTVAIVSPGYFEAMGAHVEGRTLEWSSMNANDGALLVSKSFADHHWPNERAIDKGIRAGVPGSAKYYRVVGVVDDIRSNGLDAPPTEIVYFPVRPLTESRLWGTPTSGYLVVKTTVSNPLTLTNAVTRAVQELEPGAAVANVASMETIVARSIARRSFTMVLLGIAAGMAVLLSAVGIYGVISYVVAQRRGEIGVRMALGAGTRHVTRMVLGQSLGLTLVGVAVGLAAALATTRVLRVLLYGVAPNDPVTLVAVPVLLLGVALIASYVPARRAARTDPVVALRSD